MAFILEYFTMYFLRIKIFLINHSICIRLRKFNIDTVLLSSTILFFIKYTMNIPISSNVSIISFIAMLLFYPEFSTKE